MHICKHFKIQELVPPAVFDARGERAWELLDERMLITLDKLRERYGPVTVNTGIRGANANGTAYARRRARITA